MVKTRMELDYIPESIKDNMMKAYYLVISLFVLNSSRYICCMDQEFFKQGTPAMKKNILILTSSEGGNLVASQAIQSYLSADYNIQLCPIFKEILAPLDPFNFLTLNHYSGEDFYKTLVPGKHFQLLGWVYQFGTWYMQSRKDSI